LVEVPRYLFYAISLVSTPAYWQKFVRYSLFLILYPTGITGEVWSIISELAFISKTGLLRYPMPNRLNFAFDYTSFLYFILATYIPGSYIMYTYMLTQRKKQLNPSASAKKTQ
jgi:very-long-chain (3R)-3-hydroxyacyl-CoA dehydratase